MTQSDKKKLKKKEKKHSIHDNRLKPTRRTKQISVKESELGSVCGLVTLSLVLILSQKMQEIWFKMWWEVNAKNAMSNGNDHIQQFHIHYC